MGCYGTWDIIMRNPEMFAAASPQSCRGDPDTSLLAGLKNMPIWSMCGTNDSYFAGAQAMADGMEQIGATAFTFTAMEGVGHSINDRGYDYPGFIDWMFGQRRDVMPPVGAGGTAGMTATSGGGTGGTSNTGDQASSAGGTSAGGAATMSTGTMDTSAGGASATLVTASTATAATTSTSSATNTTGAGGAAVSNSTIGSSVGGSATVPAPGGESDSGCACRATPVSPRGGLSCAGLLLFGVLLSRRRSRLSTPTQGALIET